MTHENTIRAWKDAAYRESLGQAERDRLAENPAGIVELEAGELERIAGGDGGTRRRLLRPRPRPVVIKKPNSSYTLFCNPSICKVVQGG